MLIENHSGWFGKNCNIRTANTDHSWICHSQWMTRWDHLCLWNVGPMAKLQRPMFAVPFLQISPYTAAYLVETSTLCKLCKPSIHTTGSPSDAQEESRTRFAKRRPPAPLPWSSFCKKKPSPSRSPRGYQPCSVDLLALLPPTRVELRRPWTPRCSGASLWLSRPWNSAGSAASRCSVASLQLPHPWSSTDPSSWRSASLIRAPSALLCLWCCALLGEDNSIWWWRTE